MSVAAYGYWAHITVKVDIWLASNIGLS